MVGDHRPLVPETEHWQFNPNTSYRTRWSVRLPGHGPERLRATSLVIPGPGAKPTAEPYHLLGLSSFLLIGETAF